MQQLRKPFQLFFLLVICIFSTSKSWAQSNTGSIKGIVTTNDGKPAADVSILLKGTKKGNATDEQGGFEFARIKQGQHILQISLAGYQTLEQAVEVSAGKVAELTITLQLTNQQLQEVTITSRKSKMPTSSVYVSKMP